MDPLTAFGLAANILQFIDFGWKLIESAVQVHGSVSGTTAQNSDLLVTVGALEEVSTDLKNSTPSGPEEKGLMTLSQKCYTLSEELLNLLKTLQTKPGSTRGSMKVAWKSWRRKDEIASIRSRLNEYRTQILLEIAYILKKDQSLLRGEIKALGRSTERIHDELEASRLDIMAKVNNAKYGGIEALNAVRDELVLFRRHVQEENQRYCILKALRFEKMEERFDDVKSEHAKTFEWIFEDRLDSDRVNDSSVVAKTNIPFMQWLRDGRGIFHVQGKAGSGKSTLMKFIYRDSRTSQILESWCGEKHLIFGRFFFWKPGTPMQRSLKGLTRSLLYTILEQAPELIEETFLRVWNNIKDVPWNVPCNIDFSLIDIRDAFVKLIANKQVYDSRYFCFFIDGLDEFDEWNGLDSEQTVYTDLIELLTSWAKDRPEVKLCVSSRDWNLFKKAFSPHQKLRLQDLTKNDMRALVKDSLLEDGTRFKNDSEVDPEFNKLVEQIVEKAEGIFLWVVLVLKSLRQGLQHKDSAKTLQKRLEMMPAGLERFLGFMLESIDPIYVQHCTQIFAIALSNRDISLLRYSFLEDIDSNPRFALDEACLLDDACLKGRLERMRFQLDASCKGLLEARKVDHDDDYSQNLPEVLYEQVTFLHRSVPDFLTEHHPQDSATVRSIKNAIMDKSEDKSVISQIYHAFLAEIRSLEFPGGYEGVSNDLGDLVEHIHDVWTKTGYLDLEIVDAFDAALQRPVFGIFANFADSPCSYYVESSSLCALQQITMHENWVDVLDIFGTFSAHGFGEFLDRICDDGSGTICGRSVNNLLYSALRGFCERCSVNISDYLNLVERLLQLKADPNSVVSYNDTYSCTSWQRFIDDTFRRLRYDREVAEMMRLLLKYKADPYLWIPEEGSNTLIFHGQKGVLFYDLNIRTSYSRFRTASGRPKKPLSLRNLIERDTPHNEAIFSMLPSHSEYETKWNSCVIVAREEARELQGLVELPEAKLLITGRAASEKEKPLPSSGQDYHRGSDSRSNDTITDLGGDAEKVRDENGKKTRDDDLVGNLGLDN